MNFVDSELQIVGVPVAMQRLHRGMCDVKGRVLLVFMPLRLQVSEQSGHCSSHSVNAWWAL
jgi:hypothetical protein